MSFLGIPGGGGGTVSEVNDSFGRILFELHVIRMTLLLFLKQSLNSKRDFNRNHETQPRPNRHITGERDRFNFVRT